MPPKQFTRTQLRVADIHDSDDTVQTAALIAEHATPAGSPQAMIDDDNDLDDDLGDQGDDDPPIDNDIGDRCSQVNDENCLDVATQNWSMLQTLLVYQP